MPIILISFEKGHDDKTIIHMKNTFQLKHPPLCVMKKHTQQEDIFMHINFKHIGRRILSRAAARS